MKEIFIAFLALGAAAAVAQQFYPQLQPLYSYHGNPAYPQPGGYAYNNFNNNNYHNNNWNNTIQFGRHDLALGAPSPMEKLLLHTTVYKRPGLWSSFATKEIVFPPKGSRIKVNITRILATDRDKRGTGAFVKLVDGGIGHKNVTLIFRSQRNQSINYELQIFGYPR